MMRQIINFKCQIWIGILACFIFTPSFAGQGQTRLSSEIVLEPSCLINSKVVVNGSINQKIGEINFGEQSAGFTTVNTMLTNEFNAIKIHCPLNTEVNVTFNAGQNSTNVPTVNEGKANRAMTDGNGHYIAYQIFQDNKNGKVLTPTTQLRFDGGSEQQIRVYAEAYSSNRVVKGQYFDQITVTIAF